MAQNKVEIIKIYQAFGEKIMSEPTIVSNPFSHIPAIKQNHRNGCWAACMEWWSKGVLGYGGFTQDNIREIDVIKEMYETNSTNGKNWNKKGKKYGSLEKHELIGFLQCAPWSLNAQEVTNFNSATLQTRLQRGPVVIGFYDLSGNTWHVNIICGYDSNYDMAVVMEPRDGEFVDKAFSDFTMNSSFNVLGWRN